MNTFNNQTQKIEDIKTSFINNILMNTFNNQTQKIEDIKTSFQNPLKGVLKYIQHNQFDVSVYFFGNNVIITQEIIDKLILGFSKKISEIKEMKKYVIKSDLSEIEKRFLLNTLNITALKYISFKYSVYLEAEKAGFELSKEKRELYVERVNKLQNIYYGPEISIIKSEKEAILLHLYKSVNNKGDRLTDKEKNNFLKFLDSFSFMSNDNLEVDKNELKVDKIDNIFLSKENVLRIFELVLNIYGLDDWRISVENVGNFLVRKKQIVIPEGKFDINSLKKILQLIDHEIGVHAIRGYNTDKTLNTSGEGYIEIEEGFAMLTESLFDVSISEVKVVPSKSHISTFFAENLDGVETQEMLRIYYKMVMKKGTPDEIIEKEAKDRTLRVKRFVSFKQKGANRKDVSYTRGQKQIVEYLQNLDDREIGDFISNFYFSKLALGDIGLVQEFRESLGIDEKELKYPLWIGKILYKKLLGEKIFLQKLQTEDFRFRVIDKIPFNVKRKIIEILNLIKA